jgi:aryl-alcohol dehydrogenase-like predicted oxidoreductase
MFGESEYDPQQSYTSIPIEEQVRALQDAQTAGKIGHFGVSNETAWGLTRFAAGGVSRSHSPVTFRKLGGRLGEGGP